MGSRSCGRVGRAAGEVAGAAPCAGCWRRQPPRVPRSSAIAPKLEIKKKKKNGGGSLGRPAQAAGPGTRGRGAVGVAGAPGAARPRLAQPRGAGSHGRKPRAGLSASLFGGAWPNPPRAQGPQRGVLLDPRGLQGSGSACGSKQVFVVQK